MAKIQYIKIKNKIHAQNKMPQNTFKEPQTGEMLVMYNTEKGLVLQNKKKTKQKTKEKNPQKH